MTDADVLLYLNFVATTPSLRVKHGNYLVNGTKHISNKIVSKYRKYPNFLDILQTSREALWQAILSYDPSKGVTFSSWSYMWIRKQVAIEARKDKTNRMAFDSLPQDTEETDIGNPIESCESFLEKKDIMRQLDVFLKSLSDRELIILEECILKNKSYRDVGNLLKISHESVRKSKDSLIIKVMKEGKKIMSC